MMARQRLGRLAVVVMVVGSAGVAGVAGAQEGWRDLFDGKSLEGWVQRGGEARYEVVDGTVVGTTVAGTPNSFLCPQESYGDFILEYEMWVEPGLNSGVQIRSLSEPGYQNGRVHGYQVEADTAERAWSAGIYDEARRGWLYPLASNPKGRSAWKNGQWNHYRVEAIGSHIRTWLNGVPCADLVDDMTAEGFIGLQVHSIGNRQAEAGKHIKWRNLRIRTEDLADAARPADYSIPQVNLVANALSAREEELGWRLLFDGQNMGQWRAVRGEGFPEKGWRMEEGVLKVVGGGGDIVTREQYGDFELKIDFRLTKGANSGIKYFIDPARTGGAVVGCEYQILDDRNHPDAGQGVAGNRTLASLYDLIAARHPNKLINWGSWNQAYIRVDGKKVVHWLNNVPVVEYERGTQMWEALVATSKFAKYEGFGNWERGHILLQDHGDEVDFRSIKIRELK